MAYSDKFIDRNPCIPTAGISLYSKNENVENCLTFPLLDTLPTEEKIKPSYEVHPVPSPQIDLYEGAYTKMRELINPPLKNMSQNLRQEFDETVYDSYWNTSLGKVHDMSKNLPECIDLNTTTFGMKTPIKDTMKELVNPDKTPGQVLTEADIGHELYIKSHNDYNVGEQINRRYNDPPINKNLIWGKRITCDPEGGVTKKALRWYDESNLTAVSEIQARHKFFSKPQVGKVFAPNQNINCVPKHHTFGKPLRREFFGAGDLMRDCAPSQDKIDLSEELTHINLLRTTISKRVPHFPHRDFVENLVSEDKENTGCLSLPKLYDICSSYGIQADKNKLEALLLRLGILSQDSMVKYKDFAAVINVNNVFPTLDKLNDIPPEFLSYETTYKAATDDLKRKCEALPTAAGLPSWCTSQDSLNSETSMETLISPNIFTQYGLSHRDFFKPQTREYIHELFSRIGVNLPAELFHQICDIAEQQDATGGVCVETFRNILDREATRNFK